MRRREYAPHPAKVPTQEEARKRWIRRRGPRTSGELPYASYPQRARVGDASFQEPVIPRAGEPIADLMVRLKRSGKIKISAAYTAGFLGSTTSTKASRSSMPPSCGPTGCPPAS